MPKKQKVHTKYYLADGTQVPSVTTIIGGQLGWNKRMLMAWSKREAAAGRDPDKVRDKAADIGTLAAAQSRLLGALWPLLAPRGRLLYATCSYLPRENDHVLAEFLAKHPDASGGPMLCAWGRAGGYGRQVLPDEDSMDGFYYALLSKH